MIFFKWLLRNLSIFLLVTPAVDFMKKLPFTNWQKWQKLILKLRLKNSKFTMKTLITLDIDFNVPHVIATIHEKTTWKFTLRNPMIMNLIQMQPALKSKKIEKGFNVPPVIATIHEKTNWRKLNAHIKKSNNNEEL